MSLQAGKAEEHNPQSLLIPAREATESVPSEVEIAENKLPVIEVTDVEAGVNKTDAASLVSSNASATQDSCRTPQGTLISSQPGPISQPSISLKPKHFTRRRSPPVFLRILTITLAVLKIVFVYAIPGFMFVTLIFVLWLGLPLGFVAGNGAASMVIGNAILNRAHVSGYTSNAKAAAIGATGACIAAFIVGPTLYCVAQCVPFIFLPKEPDYSSNDFHSMQGEEQQMPWYITFFTGLLAHTLGGVIGWAILRRNHVDLEGIDAGHAARAAALGSVLFSVGSILAGPIFLGVIAIVMSPLFIAMTMGFKWVYIRSRVTWEQKGNWTITKTCYCYCYGFCERDEEIDAELAKIGR